MMNYGTQETGAKVELEPIARMNVKDTMDSTEKALGELEAVLCDMKKMVNGGEESETQAARISPTNMNEQAEKNRALAMSCLRMAQELHQGLLG